MSDQETVSTSTSTDSVPESSSNTSSISSLYENKIRELEDLISDLRQEIAKQRQKSDENVGSLKQQLEQAVDQLSSLTKKFDEVKQRPSQTLVPPPPPPPETSQAVKPSQQINEGSRPSGWRRIW